MQDKDRVVGNKDTGIEILRSNELFRRLAEPIEPGNFPEIKDAELYIKHDGSIVNAEGWYHPEDKLIGEVLYIPDQQGDRLIFGQKYRKTSLYPGTHTPIPYVLRNQALAGYDPQMRQDNNLFFARYKRIFPTHDFKAYLPGQRVLAKILSVFPEETGRIKSDLANSQQLLGIDLSAFSLGFTGAPLLGNFIDIHDLDIVFSNLLEENLELAKRIRQLVATSPYRRVIEGGKGWNIRFYNDNGTLMCSFFTYRNPEDAPLRNFEMTVLIEDVEIEATVVNDVHTVYTPTILGISGVKIRKIGDKEVEREAPEKNMKLIAYHTATRGECFEGDIVNANGALVSVKTPVEEYRAICVIGREGVRNLTPTWENFYED